MRKAKAKAQNGDTNPGNTPDPGNKENPDNNENPDDKGNTENKGDTTDGTGTGSDGSYELH